MLRAERPTLMLLLILASAIPLAAALVPLVEVPLTGLDPASRFAASPITLWLHAGAGIVFGVAGLLQAAGLRRGGGAHRIAGRAFALAGAGVGLSGLALMLSVEPVAIPPLTAFRAAVGAALLAALALGIRAARARDLAGHRAWMIRAYGLGMGGGTAALPLFPAITLFGLPPSGGLTDTVLMLWWIGVIGLAETVIRNPRGATR
jgi:hypothetical protein